MLFEGRSILKMVTQRFVRGARDEWRKTMYCFLYLESNGTLWIERHLKEIVWRKEMSRKTHIPPRTIPYFMRNKIIIKDIAIGSHCLAVDSNDRVYSWEYKLNKSMMKKVCLCEWSGLVP